MANLDKHTPVIIRYKGYVIAGSTLYIPEVISKRKEDEMELSTVEIQGDIDIVPSY